MAIHSVLWFILAASACLQTAAFTIPSWADEKRFGMYQDAWKRLSGSVGSTYYLVRTTYHNDEYMWGTNFQCVTVREVTFDRTSNKGVLEFNFMNKTRYSGWINSYTVNRTVKPYKQYSYSKPNALQFLLNANRMLVKTFIFTDGKTCDLLSVPYLKNRLECELWVNSQYADDIPLCCLFLLEDRCPRRTTYTVYNKTLCSNPLPRPRPR
uniref:Putative lipocalin-5 1 n=1 Tax=Amblyomma triste TaxID=251400 RepID=A0A023GMN8_AMBTT